MKRKRKYKIKTPKIIYKYVPSENAQEKLDEIYNYIFTKAIEKYGDKLYKKKGKNHAKNRNNM